MRKSVLMDDDNQIISSSNFGNIPQTTKNASGKKDQRGFVPFMEELESVDDV